MRESVFATCLLLLVVWISISDLRRREIPDGASLLVALFGVSLWCGELLNLLLSCMVGAASWVLIGLIGGYLWQRTGREWLGLGDAKLIAAGTLVVGWKALWVMILLASIGGICAWFSQRRSSGEEGVPFGPFLAYAIFVTHLIAGPSS